MDRQDFTRLVQDICDYYQRKEPKLETIGLWYEKVRGVPGIAVQFIRDYIQRNEYPSGNLPNAIQEAWRIWKTENPTKIIHQQTQCDSCNGEGLIIFSKVYDDVNSDNYSYDHSCRCGDCQNWQGRYGTSISILKKTQLEAMGFTVYEYPKARSVGKPEFHDLKEVVNGIPF